MRILFTHLFMFSLFTLLSAQSGSVRLGKQITNGSTDGGCATDCVTNVSASDPTFICNPSGTGNSVETMTHDLTVPAGYYMELTVVTNACDVSTDGLDTGDNFYVNGVLIVQGNMNTRVNYSGCFVNNTTSDMIIPLSLTANRRDETVTASWNLSATNPGGLCTSAAPLPVKLTAFTLHKMNQITRLSFSTVSETNNDYFTIERSTDGRDFEAIGDIKGAGNSTEQISYTFIDENPEQGINYYRIKQTDFDGNNSYSDVKYVIHGSNNRTWVTPKNTSGIVTIDTDLDNYDLAVYSSMGQMVEKYSAYSGKQTVDISELPNGIYYFVVHSTTSQETIKVVKY